MIPREGFIQEVCDGQIDLYGRLRTLSCLPYPRICACTIAVGVDVLSCSIGPFWTLTTLILTLYTTSTLTASISAYLASPESTTSNLPLLTTATSIVYIYGLGVPALLWATTKWLGVAEWGVAEALGIYGYAMSVFVPISLVCLVPVGVLRWVLVGVGAASSGYFM